MTEFMFDFLKDITLENFDNFFMRCSLSSLFFAPVSTRLPAVWALLMEAHCCQQIKKEKWQLGMNKYAWSVRIWTYYL